MNLLNTLQNLKNDKKKLVIIGSIAIFVMLLFNFLLFVLLVNNDKNIETSSIQNDSIEVFKDRSVLGRDFNIAENKADTITENLSKILELYGDSIVLEINKISDTCKVNSTLNVKIKKIKLKLNLDLTYLIYPYPSKEETLRLTRLLNFRLGRFLDENGTDYISIEKLQKDFNIYLKNNITKYPYKFNGKVKILLHKFNLDIHKK